MSRKSYQSPCYCTNMRRGTGVITEYYNAAFQQIGLSAAQYYLLLNLFRLGTANTSQWALHVGLERSTLVRNAKTLQSNGWITDAAIGGTCHQFELTAQGKELLNQAVPIWERAQGEIVDYLGASDAAMLLHLMEKLQGMKENGIKGGK